MSEESLSRAAQGDEEAFRELTDPYHRELQFHCYRILGSMQDAEDALQETLLSAWRGLPGYEGRASLRAWLYRIATNRCLDALRDLRRQPPPAPDPPFDALGFHAAEVADTRVAARTRSRAPSSVRGRRSNSYVPHHTARKPHCPTRRKSAN